MSEQQEIDFSAEASASKHSRLSANNLNKRYKKRTVVHDVSFDVKSGEVVGLLGPNGAGKTTTFYMIVGLVASDGGEVYLDDDRITHFPIHRRAHMGVSYLPQEASVFRKLTVTENIKAVLELQKLSKDEVHSSLETLLEDLHIAHIRDNTAASLSGGERRRVEIARALACEPRFMLLDEPFAGVDPISIIDIQKIIVHLRERGIGILITEHNVRETLGTCDRAYILAGGRVIAEGHPDEIVRNVEVRQVYLGENFSM
jgi:lipopolysaccharide export system ATP-binding protein